MKKTPNGKGFWKRWNPKPTIAKKNGATYELFSNSPIPDFVKKWLKSKGVLFHEILH